MTTKMIPLIVIAFIMIGCKSPLITAENGGQPEFTNDVVKRQDLTGYSFFDGKLVVPESAQATAFSPYDTPVLAVMTRSGKHVERGEPIVKLTIPGADAATAAAKVGVDSAKADYSAQQADGSAPVRAARQALADAQAAEKTARDTVASGGQADIDGATQVRIDAEAALEKAQQDMRHSLQPTKDAVTNAATVLATAKADAAQGIVRAPISGTIISFDAQPGMTAKSQQALATIINFDKVRVQGLVPPELKSLVVKGSRLIVAMNGASSDPLDGLVVDVTVAPPSEGQAGSGYLAVIEFIDPKSLAQLSTVKRIGVKTGTAKNVLVVPTGAVATKDGKTTVSVQSDGKWIETAVTTGISDGALTEIKSGLTEGSVVRVPAQPKAP